MSDWPLEQQLQLNGSNRVLLIVCYKRYLINCNLGDLSVEYSYVCEVNVAQQSRMFVLRQVVLRKKEIGLCHCFFFGFLLFSYWFTAFLKTSPLWQKHFSSDFIFNCTKLNHAFWLKPFFSVADTLPCIDNI